MVLITVLLPAFVAGFVVMISFTAIKHKDFQNDEKLMGLMAKSVVIGTATTIVMCIQPILAIWWVPWLKLICSMSHKSSALCHFCY